MAPMDQREFEQRVRALMKSVAANEPSDQIVSQIETLRKEAAPTEKILRETMAGAKINRLRHNTESAIAVAATALVSDWKKLVGREKVARARARAASSAAAATPTTPTTPPLDTDTPNSAASSMREPFAGDPEKRSAGNDGVSAARTSDDTRNNVIMIMYNGLAYRSTESCEAVLSRAVEVEEAAFKHYEGTTQDYKTKMRSLMLSLKNKTNRALGQRVMSGDILASEFVVMSKDELRSEEQKSKDEETGRENLKKAHRPVEEPAIPSSRRCNKCKENMISYHQAQTRSADEPMTTFFTCTVCGHRWKE